MEQPRRLHKWRINRGRKGERYIKYLSPFHSTYLWVSRKVVDEVEQYMKDYYEVPLPHEVYPILKAKVEVDHLEAIEHFPELDNPYCELDWVYIDKKQNE